MKIGNPQPMPDEPTEYVGLAFYYDLVKVLPGESYKFCYFEHCEFDGVGPVMFDNCTFTGRFDVKANSSVYFYSCDFRVGGLGYES